MSLILIVCTGNICRSPVAAALIRRELDERALDEIDVESAGTYAWDGNSATEGSIIVAAENGLDLGAHEAQSLTPELVERSDLVLTMEFGHATEVVRSGGGGRTHLLGEYAGLERHKAEVDDPYGASLSAYREMFQTLEPMAQSAVERFVFESNS